MVLCEYVKNSARGFSALIILLVIAALLGGGYVYWRNSVQTPFSLSQTPVATSTLASGVQKTPPQSSDGRYEKSLYDHYDLLDIDNGNAFALKLTQKIVGVNAQGTTTLVADVRAMAPQFLHDDPAGHQMQFQLIKPSPTTGNKIFFSIHPYAIDYGNGNDDYYSYDAKTNAFAKLSGINSIEPDWADTSPDGFRLVQMTCQYPHNTTDCRTLVLIDLWNDKASTLVTLPEGQTFAPTTDHFAGQAIGMFNWVDNHTLSYNVYDYTKDPVSVTQSDPRYPFDTPPSAFPDGLYQPFLKTITISIP